MISTYSQYLCLKNQNDTQQILRKRSQFQSEIFFFQLFD